MITSRNSADAELTRGPAALIGYNNAAVAGDGAVYFSDSSVESETFNYEQNEPAALAEEIRTEKLRT
ncbi:MAG: hypothetical protein ACRDTG_10615 [Pseudonocardiaceae bacterium]